MIHLQPCYPFWLFLMQFSCLFIWTVLSLRFEVRGSLSNLWIQWLNRRCEVIVRQRWVAFLCDCVQYWSVTTPTFLHTRMPTHISVCIILMNRIHMLTVAFFRSLFVLHIELWVYVMWNILSCLNVKVAHLWEDFRPSVRIQMHYCFIMTLRWHEDSIGDSEREYE